MIKEPHFIKGYSLKKRRQRRTWFAQTSRRAGLEPLYAALLISTRKHTFSSINALPKGFLIPAKTCIFR